MRVLQEKKYRWSLLRSLMVGSVSFWIGMLLGFVTASTAVAGNDLFTINDIAGDDYGSGDIVYPGRSDFTKGDLDLLWVRAQTDAHGTWFTARFKNPIRDPKLANLSVGPEPLNTVARLGFYNLNIDIYIDKDRIPGSGSTDALPGRNVEIDSAHAWETCISLTPRPQVTQSLFEQFIQTVMEQQQRTREGKVSADELANIRVQAKAEIARKYFFPNKVIVKKRDISFFVPTSFLGAIANPEWSYTIFVTGAEVNATVRVTGISTAKFMLSIIPVAIGRPLDRFGLETDADPGQPPIIDLLSPQPGYQEKILADYNMSAGRLVHLSGVIPSTTKVQEDTPQLIKSAPLLSPSIGQEQETPLSKQTIDGERSIAERLRTLDELNNQGLITDQEYQQQRLKILSDI